MAYMDLVTSHRGVAHITTQNVIDLIGGLSGDISGVKIFPDLYNGFTHEITTSTRVQLQPGAGLAGGYFFILNSLYNWDLDPGAVGYSRNDVLFLVIYENFGSLVQSCDLVYAPGPPYPNGSQGGEVEEIGGANILACFKLLRAVMTDGAIVSVTSLADEYLSNEKLNNKIATPYDALENAGMFNILCYKNFKTNIAEEAVLQNEFFTYAPAGSPKQTRLAQAITEILPDEEIQNGTNAQIFSIGQLLNWLNFHTPYSTRQIRVGDVVYDNKLYQFIDSSLRIMPGDQYGGINPQTKIVHRYVRYDGANPILRKDIYSYKHREEDDYYFIADGHIDASNGSFIQITKLIVLTKSGNYLIGKQSIEFLVSHGSTQSYDESDITVEAGDTITTYYIYPGSGID
jgi:hypothetical protein